DDFRVRGHRDLRAQGRDAAAREHDRPAVDDGSGDGDQARAADGHRARGLRARDTGGEGQDGEGREPPTRSTRAHRPPPAVAMAVPPASCARSKYTTPSTSVISTRVPGSNGCALKIATSPALPT